MDFARLLWLAGAAAGAGAVNSVAGGGSLLSFPALLVAGVPPVFASATNAVAIAPGSLASAWAYRRELRENRRAGWLLAAVAGAGALVGAVLLLEVPPRVFELLVPWLVLGSALLLLAQQRVAALFRTQRVPPSRRRTLVVATLLGLLSVYGGYFGAGMGIVTLGVLALLRRMSMHEMNALKTLVVGSVNACAAAYFITRGAVDAVPAAVMAASSLLGGFFGARLARAVRPERVRGVVVVFGLVLAAFLAVRALA